MNVAGTTADSFIEIQNISNQPKGAGDVILWVRDWLIVFEIVWRRTDPASDTKSS